MATATSFPGGGGGEKRTTVDEHGIPVNVRGSNQHLWNLLQGRIVLATEEVLMAELRESIDLIMGGLTYYKPYEPREGDKPVVFSTAPTIYRSFLTGKLERISGKAENGGTADGQQGQGQGQDKKKTEGSKLSAFDKVRLGVAQNLNLDLEVSTELVVSYMMFEYKGSHISYEEIADTQHSFNVFLKALKNYYRKERICLLLAIQAILADLGNEDHQFYKIIECFQKMITYKKWCWGLLRSLSVAQEDAEVIEILHCLLLLMYKVPSDTITEFFTYFEKNGFEGLRKSEEMKMAEGAVMYAALVVSGITDCCTGTYPVEFGPAIRDFIANNFYNILHNPYNIAPVFAAYDIFCKDDEEITNQMKTLQCNPAANFKAMLKLIDNYGKGSTKDRHIISLVVSRSIFEAFESLLANYDVNHFGTSAQGFLIFAKILHHNNIAETFLCDRPLALTALYTDATTLFPLDIPSTLHLWKSLCLSVRSVELCNTIIRGVAKLNCIAEFVDQDVSMYMKRVDLYKVRNLKERTVYGIEIEENATGLLNQIGDNTCVVWELPPNSSILAFDVLRWSIQPIAEKLLQMKADNAVPIEFHDFDYAAEDLHAICDFAVQFWNSTNEQVPELINLIHPACVIMEIMIKYKGDKEERIRLIGDLFGMVAAVNKFCSEMALINYIYELLPATDSVSLISEIILGDESIKTTKCEVTLAFLNMMASFTENKKCWRQGNSSAFESHFISAIGFITENILTSCSQWRTENEGIRLKIYLKCLQIYTDIYSLEGGKWLELKRKCLKPLASSNSCLLMVIKTEEAELQESIIVPDENNRLLPTVMVTALKLLLKIIRFEIRILKHVDDVLDGMLVRILGRLVRHRLLPKIPTLTMMVLTEIAEKTTLSLLACFGNDEAAFRDIILQRLEFAAEDVHLKVAVLDFFTVISQTQIGIIECFFADGVLENSIIDLMQEENEELAVACLCFFRSLFRQRLPLPKSRADFWENIFVPISNIRPGCNLEIISSTLHILTFDLFINGTSDTNLNKELDEFFKSEKFGTVIEVVVSEPGEGGVKCLGAIKHFLTLILGRAELSKFVPIEAIGYAQSLLLERFWKADADQHQMLCATLAELLIVLTTTESATPAFMAGLLSNLSGNIGQHSLSVQLILLCLVNKCFTNCKERVNGAEVENTFRILRRIFDLSAKLLEEEETKRTYSLLSLSASIISTIINNQHIDVWGVPMEKELIPYVLLHVASIGIAKKKAANVVASCLSTLITLAEHPFGCKLISPSNVSKNLFPNLHNFTDEVCSEQWLEIFLMCLNLNSYLLMNLKNVYIEEAVAFWGEYSNFLNRKLSVMADLTEICVGIDDADKGYNDMKSVLVFGTFILHDILVLMPYVEKWRSVQPTEVFKAMRFVFYILQEVCGLLQQPFLLQTSVGIKPKSGQPDVKLSPRVMEMQAKLWEIADICIHILVKLKWMEDEYLEKGILMPTIFQLGQLTIKALTKAERKPGSPGASGFNKYASIMEKVLVVIHNYVSPILNDPSVDQKFQNAVRRDMCTDIISLCDGVRRLGCTKTDFLYSMCIQMDAKFK